MGGKLGQKDRLLGGGKAASDDKDLFSGKEGPVTGRAVRDAVSTEALLPLEPGRPGVGTGGKNDAKALEGAPVCHHLPHRTRGINSFHVGPQKLAAKVLCLLLHAPGELGAADGSAPRKVHDLGGDGDLTAKDFFLDDKYAVFCPCEVEPGGQTCWPAADDHRVIKLLIVLHTRVLLLSADQSAPTRSRVGLSVLAPGCHLAGQT